MKNKLVFLTLFALTLAGCTNLPVTTQPSVEPQVSSINLSWDSPARAGWSEALLGYVNEEFAIFDSATDTTRFCPKYKSLDKAGRLKAWGEVLVALAKYESSWNPKSASVDVGKKDQRNTWSIGLYQVSVVDQSWAGGGLEYTYEQLLTPKPNMHLMKQLVVRWLKKEPKFFLPNSSKNRYFAVGLEGNKYSKIPQIIAYVKANAPACN